MNITFSSDGCFYLCKYLKVQEMLVGKGSKIYSVFRMKCPRCQEGDFFLSHPYSMKNIGKTYTYCPSCGLKYEKEVGFYYGAMYVSYGLGVGLFVACWISINLFFPDSNVFVQIAVISGLSIFMSPYLYALSKIIWANLFFSYDPETESEFKKGSKS